MNKLLIISLLVCANLHPINIGMDSTAQEDLSTLLISLNLAPDEFLYKDHIIVTPDHPGIGIKSLQINVPLESVYDPATKKTQSIYRGDVVLKVEVEKKGSGPVNDAHIRFGYHTNQLSSPHDVFIPIQFKPAPGEEPQKITSSTKRMIPQSIQPEPKKSFSFSKYISNWIKETDSLPLRMLLVLLLGALLSLTPCIYPMIPITVSILKAQSSNSFLRNFLVALSYTCGISLTYAIFGLLASMLGPIWGSLLTNPIFVLILVALLIYCALSMFDLYDLYIPRFMLHAGSKKHNNSLLSAFIFGVVSGTIASPCVSPGLALVLSIVATIGNLFIGFALLFAFGIGLSLPLLIIGTFSTSASMFPKAGMWMVEVKKLLGLVLLGLCFYYLQNIMPWMYLLALAAIFCCIAGTYWLHHALSVKSTTWKNIDNLLGILLLGGSVLLAVESAQIFFAPAQHADSNSHETTTTPSGFTWKKEYIQARAEAIHTKKLLFLDFWATWCPICVRINNTVFKDHNVLNALAASYVSVSVDSSTSSNEPYAYLGGKYKITGFPTFLIVDPVTEKVIKEFSSELFSMPRDNFISKLEKYAQH